MTARHSGEEPSRGGDRASAPHDDQESRHPSAPLPPMPSGVWDRLHSRRGAPLDDAGPWPSRSSPGPAGGRRAGCPRSRADEPADDDTEAHPVDPHAWEDQTGGLDVIGAHVAEEPPRRLGRRARREAAEAARRARPDAGEDLDEADAHDLEHDVLDSDGTTPTAWSTTRTSGSTSRSSPTTRAPPAPGGAGGRSPSSSPC